MKTNIYTNNKNIVVAVGEFEGVTYRGVAKCAPTDEFDFETGKNLAIARLDEKIAYARVNYLADMLNRIHKTLDTLIECNNSYTKKLDKAFSNYDLCRERRVTAEDVLKDNDIPSA